MSENKEENIILRSLHTYMLDILNNRFTFSCLLSDDGGDRYEVSIYGQVKLGVVVAYTDISDKGVGKLAKIKIDIDCLYISPGIPVIGLEFVKDKWYVVLMLATKSIKEDSSSESIIIETYVEGEMEFFDSDGGTGDGDP